MTDRIITVNLIPYWVDKRGKGYRPGRIVRRGELGPHSALTVELEPIGRERKPRTVTVLPNDVVPYSDKRATEIREHVRSMGMVPAW